MNAKGLLFKDAEVGIFPCKPTFGDVKNVLLLAYRMIRMLCCFPILFGLGGVVNAQEYNDPERILEIMQKSKVQYKVLLEESFVADPPPHGENNSPFTYQLTTDDGPTIMTYTFDADMEAEFSAGERAFKAGDFADARSHYIAAHEQHPEIALIVTYIGQTYLAEGNHLAAADWLKTAIDINFHDYMAHWFLAQNLLQLGKRDEAAKEIAIAWVLNRNHGPIHQAVAAIFKENGMKFDDFEFSPNYTITESGEDIQIRFSQDWMIYAFCKALWQYEPGYHRELGGGRTEYDYDEERECIGNLAMVYQRSRHGKKGRLAELDALLRAIEVKRPMAFIFMEIWLPRDPIIAYTQSETTIRELADYVLEVRGRKK